MTGMAVSFWHWWALAGVLLALEIAAPGVFFLWVSIGAGVAGVVALAAPALSWEICAIIMMAVAVVSAYFGRGFYAGRRRHGQGEEGGTLNRRGARLVGSVVTLEQPIVNGAGRVQIDGSHWTVNGPDAPAGAKVRVTEAEGTILKVTPD
jgi:membrane protein implicated in regulation of membrane protease activity